MRIFTIIFQKFSIGLICLIILDCMPKLDRFPLQFLNLWSFLGPNATRLASPRPLRVNLYSMAFSQIQIQNLSDEPITLGENGNSQIQIFSLSGGNVNFRIVRQPLDHTCRIINPTGTYSETLELEINCFSVLEVIPPNRSMLLPTENIVFRFSDTITFDPDTDGDGGDMEPNGSLSFPITTTNPDLVDDTLTVTLDGASTWKPGIGKFVRLRFRNGQGKLLAAGTYVYRTNIASALRFVSPSGNDANDGLTPSTAFRNIQRGINDMDPCPDRTCAVLVEAGNYDGAAMGPTITLSDGISVLGSFTAGSNFRTRIPGNHSSRITYPNPDPAFCGEFITDPCFGVSLGNLGEETIFSGFTVLPASSFHSIGVYSKGKAKIIQNRIESGPIATVAGTYTAVVLETESGTVEKNTIRTPVCTIHSVTITGIELRGGGSFQPVIQDNTIQLGECIRNNVSSTGIFATGGDPVDWNQVTGNLIEVGDLDPTAGTTATGVRSDAPGTITLSNHEIRVGTAQSVFGVLSNLNSIDLGSSGPVQIQLGTAQVTKSGVESGLGALLRVRDTTIEFGNMANAFGGGSYGILHGTSGGLTEIYDSRINIGSVSVSPGPNHSIYGIATLSEDSGSAIERNRIRMGDLTSTDSGDSVGIYWFGQSDGRIVNNIIFGGESNQSAANIAIQNNGLGIQILHNTLIASTAGDPANSALIRFDGLPGKVDIRNNILLHRSGYDTCIELENNITADSFIQGNVFAGCPNYVFISSIPKELTQICTDGELCDDLAIPHFPSNPQFQKNNKGIAGQLQLVSPFSNPRNANFLSGTLCAITQLDNYLPQVPDDWSGTPFVRPNPNIPGAVSAGAIQYDGPCTP
jgi:hypothetical protein